MDLNALRRGDLAGARQVSLVRSGLAVWPEALSGLADSLEILDLSGNPLTALPHDLSRFTRLRVLFLSYTQMRCLPEVLGDLPALTQIGARGAGLIEIPAAALPPALRWLTLTDNAITRLPDALGDRPALRKLLLAGNRLTALPESLAGAAGLELLRLSANQLPSLPPWLTQLPSLAWLAWAGNRFDPAPPMQNATIPWARLLAEPGAAAPLGEGASGTVQAMRLLPKALPVAVKLFKGRMTSDGLPGQEMEAMLAAGQHPHLLAALGRVSGHPDGQEALVMPRLGPAMRPLAAPPSLESCTRDLYPPAACFTATETLRLLRAVAAALAHLHAQRLSHGDLYAHNILWDPSAAVLSDFGAASTLPAGASQALLAPDLRAFGLLMEELLAHCPEAHGDIALASLAAACQAPSVAARPSAADTLAALDAAGARG